MQVYILDTKEQIGEAAATIFAGEILKNPNCVLGFATGSSPLPLYNSLVELNKKKVISFSQVTTFNLDEYKGLDKTHPQSYHSFMWDNLFSKIDINEKQVNIPGNSPSSYEKLLVKAGKIDVQVLGIGNNGHIAFNEPSEEFKFETHIVNLTESTIQANKRFFKGDITKVPKKAISMGTGEIIKNSRTIVFIATGEQKAEAVKAMIQGPITPKCQASMLQVHPNTIVFLDKAAAKLL